MNIKTKTPSDSPYMGRIDTLVHELCPEGVEKVKLGLVAEIGTGSGNRQDSEENGNYPFFVRSKEVLRSNTYEFDEEAILIPGEGGIGDIFHYYKGKYALHQRTYRIHSVQEKLNAKYLYYFLFANFKSYIMRKAVASTATSIRKPMIEGFSIPLPPLSIQQEIVSVLDSFTTLIDKMKQEVEKRKKQMEYYREELLSPIGGYEIKTLGEIGTFTRGNGLQKTDFTEEGYPCIHYGQIHTFYGTSTYCTKSFCEEEFAKKLRKAKTGDLLIATTSEDVEACCKATVWLGEGEVAFSGDSYCYSHNQNPKYIAYLFQTEMFAKQKRMVAKGAKVVRVTGESMAEFSFSFPSLEKQSSIVSTLDKFESYISKLEKMIALRQKQYEYYREQLLTFE